MIFAAGWELPAAQFNYRLSSFVCLLVIFYCSYPYQVIFVCLFVFFFLLFLSLPGDFCSWMGVACRAVQLQPLPDLCAHNLGTRARVGSRQVESGAENSFLVAKRNLTTIWFIVDFIFERLHMCVRVLFFGTCPVQNKQ